jgi:hypothetical protein
MTLNLGQLPNGPNDGGLMVMRGTANLFGQYFEEHKHLEVGWADTPHTQKSKYPNTVNTRYHIT